MLTANINYNRRLKRSRTRVDDELLPGKSAIPVYMSSLVRTPCLFGLFCPSVYVTNEVWEEEKLFDFVLRHENIHYIHKDHWWAFVRMVCFCLHWYNPLVWFSVYLSKQDGELACDEGVVERLEEKQRVDYGYALLEFSRMKDPGISGWQLSTTMRGNKLRLKERLQMIVDTPGKAKGIQILLCLLVGCLLVVTFTGRKTGSMSLAAGKTETEDAIVEQEERIPVSIGETEPLAEPESSKEIPQKEEPESFEESTSIVIGETGDKIDTACFQVNNLGGVTFALSAEDMEHSRIFFSRYFGTDTRYNLSGYDKSISSIGTVSGRRVWFSPMLFRVQPENMDAMTDEEVVIWYFERVPLAGGSKVESIDQHYEDMWTIQTEAGSWFEVIYNAELREVSEVVGPYPDYPVH